ncbi:hypothetical protein DB346_13715 [Verrucomicrobia bacterium LW23]|nr:hypothetical protein DB346_13715 [Verrucomicrobia bacterium LW23]
MPDFSPLSQSTQSFASQQSEARRRDDDDIRRRALDIRKREAEAKGQAASDLQQEVERDADAFASLLTGAADGTDTAQEADKAGSPFDLRPGQEEELQAAGDIFSQLLGCGAEEQEGAQSLPNTYGAAGETDGGEGAEAAESSTARQGTGAEGDLSTQGGGAGDAGGMSAFSPFSNPLSGWGAQQGLAEMRSAGGSSEAGGTEGSGEAGDTDSAEGTGESDGASSSSSASGDEDSSVSASGGDGGMMSLFGTSGAGSGGAGPAGGLPGRSHGGDAGAGGHGGGGASPFGTSTGTGSGDGMDRAALEAAALNVASLQQSLLSSLHGPAGAGRTPGVDETQGTSGPAASAEMIEKLGTQVVESMLVTDPAHAQRQEVRLKIRDSVLKDTEVRVFRDGNDVHVEFLTPSEDSAQTLHQNASDLEETLRERLGAVGVQVRIAKTNAEGEEEA